MWVSSCCLLVTTTIQVYRVFQHIVMHLLGYFFLNIMPDTVLHNNVNHISCFYQLKRCRLFTFVLFTFVFYNNKPNLISTNVRFLVAHINTSPIKVNRRLIKRLILFSVILSSSTSVKMNFFLFVPFRSLRHSFSWLLIAFLQRVKLV